MCAVLSVVAAFAAIVATAGATSGPTRYAYWADYSASIYRTDVASGASSQLVTGAGSSTNGVSIDRAQGRIYWVARSDSSLYSADLDGTDLDSVDMGGDMSISDGTAIDAKNRKIYWPNVGGTIGWANLDDLSVHGILNIGPAAINAPQGIGVDSLSGIVYWTNTSAGVGDSQIGWANVDGSGTGGGLATSGSMDVPVGASVVPSLQWIFWAGYGSSQVFRMNLDGSGVVPVVPSGASINTPGGTGFDLALNRLWVGNYGNNTLAVMDPDGANAVGHAAGASPWGNIAIGGAGVLTALNELSLVSAGSEPTSGLLKLKNTGDYPIEMYGGANDPASPLAVGSGCPSVLAVGEICELTVTYTPGSEGPFSDEVAVKTDAGKFKFLVSASQGPAAAKPQLKGVRAVKRCADGDAAGAISVGFESATVTPVTASLQRSSTRLRKVPRSCPSRAGNTDYVSKPIGKKTVKTFSATAGQQTATLKQMFGTKKLTPGRYRVLLNYKDVFGSTVSKGTWVWALR